MSVATLMGTETCGAAQGDEDSKKAVQATMRILRDAYQERDWETFKKHLTPKGWTQFKRQIVISTFMWCNPAYPVPLEDRDKIREQLIKAYAEHGVSEVVAPNLNEMIDGLDWDAYEEFLAKSFEAADENLTQSMNHEGLLTAIADILVDPSFPHFGDILFRMSKLEFLEFENELATARMVFEPLPVDGGEVVVVGSQPFILRFVAADDQWRFDGINMKRTLELTRNEFSRDLPIDD